MVIVESAEEAMSLLLNTQFDVMFTDFNLPGMNGVELLKHVRTNTNCEDMPVILVTADINAIQLAKSEGVTACMVKPIRKEAISNAILRLCECVKQSHKLQQSTAKTN